VALSVAYGAGLRVSEVVALKVSDIDSKRMVIRIDQGNRIVIFSRSEHRQADMARELVDPEQRLRFFIGGVRDRDRLHWAMERIDVVIHAAALKRIEVGAYNPLEVKKTNIDGAGQCDRSRDRSGVHPVLHDDAGPSAMRRPNGAHAHHLQAGSQKRQPVAFASTEKNPGKMAGPIGRFRRENMPPEMRVPLERRGDIK
jgi:Polysaccharide biosynthesis protein